MNTNSSTKRLIELTKKDKKDNKDKKGKKKHRQTDKMIKTG